MVCAVVVAQLPPGICWYPESEKPKTKAKTWENCLAHNVNGDRDDIQILHKINGI